MHCKYYVSVGYDDGCYFTWQDVGTVTLVLKKFSSVCAQALNCVWLFATPWTVACQVPLPMGFPRQEYWSGLPLPCPGDLPHSEIKSTSLVSPALAGGLFITEPPSNYYIIFSCDYGCCYYKWQDVGIVTLVLNRLSRGKTKLNSLESQLLIKYKMWNWFLSNQVLNDKLVFETRIWRPHLVPLLCKLLSIFPRWKFELAWWSLYSTRE